MVLEMGSMWADLPVGQNLAAVARPRLSAGGKPIGAVRNAAALPCKPDEGPLDAGRFRFGRSAQSMLPGYDRYLGSDGGVYLRPRAMRVDTYC